jgi:hypothetical protein
MQNFHFEKIKFFTGSSDTLLITSYLNINNDINTSEKGYMYFNKIIVGGMRIR